jgi:Uma2 family endonuclease
VVSPGDTPPEVAAKVRDHLAAGSRQVWIIRPRERTVTVHRLGAAPHHLGTADTLDGGDVLAGFSLPVAKIFGE